MHELAITESLVEAVSERVGHSAVRVLTVEIGRLSGVVPDSVRFCFDLCAKGTQLEGARLDIVEPPGRAHCQDCGRDLELSDGIPLCDCGSAQLDIVSGRQLTIKRVEIEA